MENHAAHRDARDRTFYANFDEQHFCIITSFIAIILAAMLDFSGDTNCRADAAQ